MFIRAVYFGLCPPSPSAKLEGFLFPIAASSSTARLTRPLPSTQPPSQAAVTAPSFVALGVIWTMFGHLAVLCLRSSEEVATEIDTNCGDCTPPAAGASRRRLEDLLVSA